MLKQIQLENNDGPEKNIFVVTCLHSHHISDFKNPDTRRQLFL